MERDALVPVSGLHRLYVTGEKEKVVGNARGKYPDFTV